MKLKTILMVFLIAWFIVSNIWAQGDILFSDTFTGADGTRPLNWSIINAPETNFWFLQDGQLCTGNGDDIWDNGGHSYAIINTPSAQSWNDYSIQTSCWIYQANGNVMLIARWLDETNHYRAVFETLKGGRSLKIEKILKGASSVLASVEDGVDGVNIPQIENGTSPADARTFRFIVSGSKLTFVMGDTVSVEAMDTSFPTGSAGVGEWFHYAFFDDVLVQKVQEGEISTKPSSKIPTIIQPVPSAGMTSVTPGTIFRILIGEALAEQTAEELRDQLISWGYTPIELFQKDGGYDVYLGAFLSESEAQSAKGFLEEEGLSPRRIVELSGEKAAEVKKQASSTKKLYTVLARQFNDVAMAEKMKKALEDDGYFPVEIADDGSNQKVFIGSFNSSDEADKLARALKADGYPLSVVVESQPSMDSPFNDRETSGETRPFFDPLESIADNKEWVNLTEDEQKGVIDFITIQQSMLKGDVVTKQIIELRDRIKALSDQQKNIIQGIREEAQKEEDRQRTIAELIRKVEDARDQRKWEEALNLCDEVKKVDPNNGRIAMIERGIKFIMKGEFEGSDIIKKQEMEKIKRARDKAEKLEKEQKFEQARDQWVIVINFADPGSLDYNDANTALGRIDGFLSDEKAKRQKQEQNWRYTLYGIGAIMLLLVFLIIMIVLRTRKHDRELLRQVQELTLKPLLELQEGKGPGAIEDMTSNVQPVAAAAMQTTAKPSKKVEEVPKVMPQHQEVPEPVFDVEPQQVPVPEIFPEPDLYSMPEPETTSPDIESEEPKIEEIPVSSIDNVSFQESFSGRNTKQEPINLEPSSDDIILQENLESFSDSHESVKGPAVDVDDLFGEVSAEETLKLEPLGKSEANTPKSSLDEVIALNSPNPAPVASKKQPSSPISRKDDTTEVITPIPRDYTPVPEPEEAIPDISVRETPKPVEISAISEVSQPPKESVAIPMSSNKDSNVVYEQDFDQEEVGTLPSSWKGNYNYASLVVSDTSPAPNSRKCIVFEKEKGAGSAFYCCHFADTSGVIGIEFDLRCDMKNKYLLGFYIEKDEDYRYSIHTVIQYINSGKQSTKPSLRVQGKPVPYSWGEWRHIKYIVNLIDATVDGYVDGDLVANGEKLASCPTSLNTISIRDNLATVGKLMIDNIKIYKA